MQAKLVAILLVVIVPASGWGQWSAAKDKKDATVYLFGSALYGVSTKPIYIVDWKLDKRWEILRSGQGTGWFAGVKSTFATNAGAEPPSDRTMVDPDSITGAASFDRMRGKGKTRFLYEFLPVGGEFTRKHPSSNFISAVSARWTPSPWGAGKFKRTFYPMVGMEGGHNLNRPQMLFKRSVDLSGYGPIARIATGTNGALYLVHTKDQQKKGNLYRIVVDGSYITRILLADEPFVRAEHVLDDRGDVSRQKVTAIRRNARHSIETGVTWSLNEFLGIRVQYRYGSLPPLFEFVNHQVTVGLTFKGTIQ